MVYGIQILSSLALRRKIMFFCSLAIYFQNKSHFRQTLSSRAFILKNSEVSPNDVIGSLIQSLLFMSPKFLDLTWELERVAWVCEKKAQMRVSHPMHESWHRWSQAKVRLMLSSSTVILHVYDDTSQFSKGPIKILLTFYPTCISFLCWKDVTIWKLDILKMLFYVYFKVLFWMLHVDSIRH